MPVRFRPILLLLLAGLALPAAAQSVVRAVPIEGARDLVVDDLRGRIYVGVGGTVTNANGIAVVR